MPFFNLTKKVTMKDAVMGIFLIFMGNKTLLRKDKDSKQRSSICVVLNICNQLENGGLLYAWTLDGGVEFGIGNSFNLALSRLSLIPCSVWCIYFERQLSCN